MAVTRKTSSASAATITTAVHPRYAEWLDTWQWLGYSYEGDGPFLTGEALVAHPREINYKRDQDGSVTTPLEIIGYLPKYHRRRVLARYDNFAQKIVDMIADYQFRKTASRGFDEPNARGVKDYLLWCEDVDGNGTSLDDWLKEQSRCASVYGHMGITMERQAPLVKVVRSLADQGQLVLSSYSPIDIPDWIAVRGQVQEVKLLEGVARESLLQTAAKVTTAIGSETVRDGESMEIRRWTPNFFIRYDSNGAEIARVPNPLGRPPVEFMYCRRRVRVPVIGRSMLGDPKLYRDHYNMVSEMRSLLRDQTFSMLAIQLGENEEPADGRARLGKHAGTDTIIWHKGGAEFISPADGPVATYVSSIANLEDTMFRRVGLDSSGDSGGANQSGDSRRMKAMDLNQTLSGNADEVEKFEYRIARLWFQLTYGRDAGNAAWNFPARPFI